MRASRDERAYRFYSMLFTASAQLSLDRRVNLSVCALTCGGQRWQRSRCSPDALARSRSKTLPPAPRPRPKALRPPTPARRAKRVTRAFGTGTSTSTCLPMQPDASRCNAVMKITLQMYQEGSKLTGHYTCAPGNMVCRDSNTTGTIADGKVREGNVGMRVMMPDGSSCLFNGRPSREQPPAQQVDRFVLLHAGRRLYRTGPLPGRARILRRYGISTARPLTLPATRSCKAAFASLSRYSWVASVTFPRSASAISSTRSG